MHYPCKSEFDGLASCLTHIIDACLQQFGAQIVLQTSVPVTAGAIVTIKNLLGVATLPGRIQGLIIDGIVTHAIWNEGQYLTFYVPENVTFVRPVSIQVVLQNPAGVQDAPMVTVAIANWHSRDIISKNMTGSGHAVFK